MSGNLYCTSYRYKINVLPFFGKIKRSQEMIARATLDKKYNFPLYYLSSDRLPELKNSKSGHGRLREVLVQTGSYPNIEM